MPNTREPSAAAERRYTEPRPRYGMQRVLDPAGLLPQAAWRLDNSPQLWPDECRLRLDRLNLDAASLRQLREAHDGDPRRMRRAVLEIVTARGKMHNPLTGSGGAFIGVVEELGPEAPTRPAVGARVVSLISLTATPLAIEDELDQWDGRSAQVPATGYAILYSGAPAMSVPDDLDPALVLSVLDVCGAPALTSKVIGEHAGHGTRPDVCIIGASGKSGSLSAAAARRSGASRVVGVVPGAGEAQTCRDLGLFDDIAIADARRPAEIAGAVRHPCNITVVCVDVPGCEHGAILATAPGGTVVLFSMATSFQAAALGAESIGSDVRLIIGNGYLPGHAQFALNLVRTEPALRALFGAEASQARNQAREAQP